MHEDINLVFSIDYLMLIFSLDRLDHSALILSQISIDRSPDFHTIIVRT